MAQQARPKVIHISEPVRAQVMSSSVAVTMKPLSASSSLMPEEEGIIGADRLAGRRIDDPLRGRGDEGRSPLTQSHSSAPFFHS